MVKLTEYTRYADAQAQFSSDKLWELFDGDRQTLNIAHECIDRHVDGERTAVIVVQAGGGEEVLSFRQIAEDSARFAQYLNARGIGAGDRVAIMLEPSRAFYMAVFGAMKAGAIAVPLFTIAFEFTGAGLGWTNAPAMSWGEWAGAAIIGTASLWLMTARLRPGR